MTFKVPKPKELINTFYNLFFEWQDICFVGSKEQMRLLLQLKLQCYISKTYLDEILNTFINSGIIIKTNETMKIDRKIGQRYFNLYDQKVYKRNENTSVKDLEKLEFVFNNIELKVSELTTKEDIMLLHYLEEQKGIKLKDLNFSIPYDKKDDDLYFLYDIPRTKVLYYIEALNEYDPELEKAQNEKDILRNEMKKNEKQVLINNVYTIVRNIFNESCKSIKVQNIEIKHQSLCSWDKNMLESFIANICPKSITWTDKNELILQGSEINFNVEIDEFEIYYDEFKIRLASGYMNFIVPLSKGLKEKLERFKVYEELLNEKIKKLNYEVEYF